MIIEILGCDACPAQIRWEVDMDGLPAGWGINVDGDHFCPKCAPRLDPYEEE